MHTRTSTWRAIQPPSLAFPPRVRWRLVEQAVSCSFATCLAWCSASSLRSCFFYLRASPVSLISLSTPSGFLCAMMMADVSAAAVLRPGPPESSSSRYTIAAAREHTPRSLGIGTAGSPFADDFSIRGGASEIYECHVLPVLPFNTGAGTPFPIITPGRGPSLRQPPSPVITGLFARETIAVDSSSATSIPSAVTAEETTNLSQPANPSVTFSDPFPPSHCQPKILNPSRVRPPRPSLNLACPPGCGALAARDWASPFY